MSVKKTVEAEKMRQLFSEWIETRGINKGKPYKRAPKTYPEAMRNGYKKGCGKGYIFKGFSDPFEMQEVNLVEEYMNSPYFTSDDVSSQKDFNTGFRQYKEFLELLAFPWPDKKRNRIFFGAPGTGKSYELKNECEKFLKDEENEKGYERVTFHPDYSYANFVGTYKPVPCEDGDGNNIITYEYVPGPFMRSYVSAIENPIKPFILIIEEINRANVAAVFGDVFQLLDRDKNGASEYSIQTTEDMRHYLEKKLGKDGECSSLCIPSNMFIWATMNSADQGVFPMDTAFKRRWDFEYFGIDKEESGIKGKGVILGKEQKRVEWNKLRKAINDFLAKEGINEDKQLGPYFISLPCNDKGEIDSDKFCEMFKSKVIMYLFEDVVRMKRSSNIFSGCSDDKKNRYSSICSEFDEKGIGIFSQEIQDKFLKKDKEGSAK